jgi:hypothetical protein
MQIREVTVRSPAQYLKLHSGLTPRTNKSNCKQKDKDTPKQQQLQQTLFVLKASLEARGLDYKTQTMNPTVFILVMDLFICLLIHSFIHFFSAGN